MLDDEPIDMTSIDSPHGRALIGELNSYDDPASFKDLALGVPMNELRPLLSRHFSSGELDLLADGLWRETE